MKPVFNKNNHPIEVDFKKNEENEYEVASQWKLMWWKFKKHKLAIISAPILTLLIIIAAFAEILSPHLPVERFSEYKHSPPQTLHFIHPETGFSLRPFVYDMTEEMDQDTFRRTFKEDTTKTYPVHFFVRGKEYKFWGLFKTNTHIIGLKDPDAPFFLMGTDSLGRDLFTRTLHGSRISLSFAFLGIILTVIIGIVLGGISGYFGGIVDTVIQRLIDLLLCIPAIPLWMALAAALPSDWSPAKIYLGMVMIFSIIGWTGLARVVRGKILSLREEDFTMAARLAGASNMRIILKHLIPSFASYIIINVSISIPTTILGETSLSFLGLGLQAPVVSWGVLLGESQKLENLAHHPWLLWPAAFIIVAVLIFNFLGDGLRDAADPYK
ncbi:ABC transporter permease [Lederbergia lenta]|uniref:AppC protein n=1 Tax=Lederbergia lenta TaxID=1467 RepID=A0A2X4VXK8_LEDLE|nr:ABC transporter permease [Lederbergia lenta]MEC2325391.1 ABC transporter permease [Lederbergia lenta]SQI55543.1 AppC protein [Lederbergia lenta]